MRESDLTKMKRSPFRFGKKTLGLSGVREKLSL